MNTVITFLSLIEVSVVFKISSSHPNTNLPSFSKRNFQYLNIHQFYVLQCIHKQKFYNFIYNHFYRNLDDLILYTHTTFIMILFLLYIHFHVISIYFHTIYAELNIFFSFTLDIKFIISAFIFFTLFGAQTGAY